ncbi:MAG: glutathione S-transferase N-terminal domain-containing protein [Gammaproteobacteria bacterium]|nr:glutathione S-transferase N-terminal domain-containing protein [Gammaproteobacteria bacterium]
MIDLFYWPTPNGWKVSIMLEECGLEYRTVAVDIGGGDQFKPEFLRICPNNRMPALIDHAPLGGGEPLALFESGAMLEYLADKSGKFLAKEPAARYRTLQWVYWQMANLGPMMGNANHFKNYAKNLTDDPAQLVYGTKRFCGEVDRLCGVMDAQLSANRYLAGDEYSIADIITWPWACLLDRLIGEGTIAQFPHLERWLAEVGARPAVQKGRNLHKEWSERQLTEEEETKRRALLFNQTNDKVRALREAAAKSAK